MMNFVDLRKPCEACGETVGVIVPKNGQNVVRCASCDRAAYNAPKSETGEAPRSVSRTGLKPKQRYRIVERAGWRCELCNADLKDVGFHIDHLVSVADCREYGLSQEDIDSDDNLVAACEECNLGKGSRSVHPRVLMALALKIARRNAKNRDSA